mgnify:CR=1 FL=1
MGNGGFMYCFSCGDEIDPRRYVLGYRLCMCCGEKKARQTTHTIAPMHKSNYVLIVDKKDLEGLNNKGGLVK